MIRGRPVDLAHLTVSEYMIDEFNMTWEEDYKIDTKKAAQTVTDKRNTDIYTHQHISRMITVTLTYITSYLAHEVDNVLLLNNLVLPFLVDKCHRSISLPTSSPSQDQSINEFI
jgi:hypothetical protein